jgi:hypothetical protein
MRWLNVLNLIAWIANFAGMACAFMVLYMKIDRNTQGEYIDEFGAFAFGHTLQTFVAFYLVSGIAVALVLSTIILSVQGLFLLAGWLLKGRRE